MLIAGLTWAPRQRLDVLGESNPLSRSATAMPQMTSAVNNDSRLTEDLDVETLTRSLGYQLRRVQLAFKKHYLKEAKSTGLQPQDVGAMFVIGLNPGVTPSQMSAALSLDVAQITIMLNKLELRRLVTRRVSKSDGRSRAVHLTTTGKREFLTLRKIAPMAEKSFIGDALTKDEAALLISLLARLPAGGRE